MMKYLVWNCTNRVVYFLRVENLLTVQVEAFHSKTEPQNGRWKFELGDL